MKLVINHLTTTMEGKVILKDVNIDIKNGQFVGIIGPNGSGKTTLLKNIYRLLTPKTGSIFLDEQNIYGWSTKELAKKMAVVSQDSTSQFDFTVYEMVEMGRSPHKKLLQRTDENDEKYVTQALKEVGLETYKERSFLSLSGGEKQRVFIARALAQEAKVLILDEPTNHLDIHHQLSILHLVKKLRITIVAALHDINLAIHYCDILYVMKNGEIITYGRPEEIITPDLLKRVFQVNADVTVHPRTKKIYITYYSANI